MNASEVAAKVKDKINPDLYGLVNRDKVFLGEVCRQLGIEASEVNCTQVASAMFVAGMNSGQEFPKMVYPDGPKEKGVVVNNITDEKAAMAKHKSKAEVDAKANK